MEKLLKVIFWALIGFCFVFASWYVLHNDLTFSSDIARDFLLFGEITQKKIVLIGPKSSVFGLFHGPLWLYLNYPAYLIGNGNPVMVGWWWIFLTGLFLISCFIVARKLFGKLAAYLFTLMTALYMGFHANSYINPVGAMFVIPAFFFFFIRYVETRKLKFLIAHIFTLGLIINFEMALGIPFTILSLTSLLVIILRSPHKKHLLAFLVILIPTANFFIFDIRHQFIMVHSVLRYLSPSSGDSVRYSYLNMVFDRARVATSVEFLRQDPGLRNLVISLIFFAFSFFQIKNKHYRLVYFSFFYFYLGFFVLTFINKGPILYFYFYPLFPLVFLVLCSFVTSAYKKIFLVLFALLLVLNINAAIFDMNTFLTSFTNKQDQSWKFLNTMSGKMYNGPEKKFGYFVYTPDAIAYAPKYALLYEQRVRTDKLADYFQKQAITYIMVAPPAANNPYLSYNWWKTVRVKIANQPLQTITFENDYKIEKYQLTSEEVKIPFDPGIDPGLGFR